MKSVRVNVKGLKKVEENKLKGLLSQLITEEGRGKLSNSKYNKEFLKDLVACFEYEAISEKDDHETEFRLNYPLCRLNAEKYFENIECFIKYNGWTVKDQDYFKEYLIGMCATIDADKKGISPEIEVLKDILIFVLNEMKGFNSMYEMNALVAFIAHQTLISERRKRKKSKDKKYDDTIKEMCSKFIEAYNTGKEFDNYSVLVIRLKDYVKKQIVDTNKTSVYIKLGEKIKTENDFKKLLKENQDLLQIKK